MQTWETLPKQKRARQWKYGDEFPGIFKEVVGTGSKGVAYDYFVITIHQQRVYLADGDFVVEEPDGKHHYPCKPDIWLAGHQLCESGENDIQTSVKMDKII